MGTNDKCKTTFLPEIWTGNHYFCNCQLFHQENVHEKYTPLNPTFKYKNCRGISTSLIFAPKHRFSVLFEPHGRGGSNVYQKLMF